MVYFIVFIILCRCSVYWSICMLTCTRVRSRAHTRVPPRVCEHLSLQNQLLRSDTGNAERLAISWKWKRRLTSFAQVLTHPRTADILIHQSRQTVCYGGPQSRFLWWGRWAAVRGRVAMVKLIMSRPLSCWSRNETWAALSRTWLPPLDTAGDQQGSRKGAQTWK